MRIALLTTAALVAAVAVSCLVALPPAPLTSTGHPDPALQARTMTGAVHVHSTVSDGTGTRSAIAAAAARAGLQFVVFTDHGDGTRQPEPAVYLHGVLCIDGVEISTDQGHYVALGLGTAPYRLGGEASGVAEDVRRLGGFGFVAHPDSPKSSLAWRDWNTRVDGVEWLNADTGFRQASSRRLAVTLLGYPFRSAAALAGMLTRPDATLRRWDAESQTRSMPTLAGHDAHGGISGSVEGGRGIPGVPSYEASFGSFSTRAILAAAPSGDAGADSQALLAALRGGRSYTAVQSMGSPAWLDFRAERGSAHAEMGDRLEGGGAATLRVSAAQVPGSTLVLLRAGRPVAAGTGPTLATVVSEAGAYRVEARLSASPSAVPWLLGNPIYVDVPAASMGAAPASPDVVQTLLGTDWRIERDPTSTAELGTEQGQVQMIYRLGSGGAGSQFVALVAPLEPLSAPFDGITTDLAGAAPARISVQFRSRDGQARWGTSIYVAPGGGVSTIATAALRPIERGSGPFDPGAAGSLLLVVDLVNALPGSAGRLVVRDLALTRR